MLKYLFVVIGNMKRYNRMIQSFEIPTYSLFLKKVTGGKSLKNQRDPSFEILRSFPQDDRWTGFSKVLLFILLLMNALSVFCSSPVDKTGKVLHKITLPNGSSFEVEIARTPEERALGLMFRSELAADKGMLFIFEEEDFHSFWMKNTYIHLDIIWLDRDKTIVYFHQNALPCKADPCESYSPMHKAMYVLELNAGTIKKENIRLGERLLFNIR